MGRPFVWPTAKLLKVIYTGVYRCIQICTGVYRCRYTTLQKPVERMNQQLGGRQEKVDGGQADHLFARHGL